MDLRPQGHDIIRTWLFSTVVRSHFEFGSLPWRHAALNGWILDPDRKKMSKSKGNATTPRTSSRSTARDAVRYWAASGGLGTDAALDTAPDEGRPTAGHQGAQRQPKFALSFGDVDEALDTASSPRSSPSRWTAPCWPASARWCDVATAANEACDYTRALEVTETFFWTFCDDYLELVKDRAYGSATARRRRRPRRVRRERRCASPSTSCCACWHRCSSTRPRRCGRGSTTPRRVRCTRPRGRRRPSSVTPAAPTRRSSPPSARRSPASARPSRTPRSVCAPRSPR